MAAIEAGLPRNLKRQPVMQLPDLPITEALPELLDTLSNRCNAVLVAPPGAGKTTIVPLALLDAPWSVDKKIIVLEPRRLAARAAARRMASLLGEKIGNRVGYRVRMDTRISERTRIEVVTEGVFTRMIMQDPELTGIAAVLFDEFHERNLDCDLGLALVLDVQSSLRQDLRVIAMSATIDGAAIAGLMNCEIIESAGRSYPVSVQYHEKPSGKQLEEFVVNEIQLSLRQNEGSILVFLPGQGEIERIAAQLLNRPGDNVDIHKLYGALDGAAQDQAIRPAAKGRKKVVLATSIAETSLTIDGVNTVIDSGMARLPRFEPASGLTRLETVRASRVSIDQRAGRAGRTAPGIAIRLWREQQTAALAADTPPEILSADLSHLALDLASWGVLDPAQLLWLDQPPKPALNEARAMLHQLGALEKSGHLTPHGKAMRRLALPPRHAHMLIKAAGVGCEQKAALLSVLASERGLGGNNIDLEQRFERTEKENSSRAINARDLARHLANRAKLHGVASKETQSLSIGALLSFAWPERIAQRTGKSRDGAIRYRLANGTGAELEAAHQLAGCHWLVIADVTGRAGAARIMSVAATSMKDVEKLHQHRIDNLDIVEFDQNTGKVSATRQRKLGALKLTEEKIPNPPAALVEAALIEAIRKGGILQLNWNEAGNSLRQRLVFLHHNYPRDWPNVSDEALLMRLDEWLLPFVGGKSCFSDFKPSELDNGLKLLVGWDQHLLIDDLAPRNYTTPAGSAISLWYEEDKVVLSARVQEFYGHDTHPAINNDSTPLSLELLSPAQRPVQITQDLPGFWRGSWLDVRSDMRARYPKHYWPENPFKAQPVLRTKPRRARK